MRSLYESLMDDDIRVLNNSNSKNAILTIFRSLKHFGVSWIYENRKVNRAEINKTLSTISGFQLTLDKNVKEYRSEEVQLRLRNNFSTEFTERYIRDKLELIVRELDTKGIKAEIKDHKNVPFLTFYTTIYELLIPQYNVVIYLCIINAGNVGFFFKLPDNKDFKMFEKTYVK